MLKDFSNMPDTFEVVASEYIDEVKSMAGLLRHKKTGARVVVLSNEDNNKVFNIGFRTPPTDSTGVAHIMEHSVLCGSKHFPAKDPFMELVKGSLNTFLNAMTYPDKTVYPVASCNDTDFQNLMHIYLDAVFYPNIYNHDETFRQEGWHYEVTSPDEPITINGVVYNEMKGAFSAPDQLLYRKITDTLFPDTIYGVESGGDPKHIPELTYAQYLDFHRRYYHPSNSYIYLYGDMDMCEKLMFIDREYLSHFDALAIDSTIEKQAAFAETKYSEAFYSIGSEDKEEKSTYMAYNWVLGDSLDPKLYLAFQILEYTLMDAPGAPLKQALLDEELGEDIYGSLDTSLIQPYTSIIIKNMDAAKRDDIVAIIQRELQTLVAGGLNHKTLEGAINYYEFKSREGDFGRWPKGLMVGLQLMDSWLYDDTKPFIHLKYQAVFDELKAGLASGYFEQLIQTYMIDNTHASVLLLKPERGLVAKEDAALADELAKFKESLSDNELQQLIDATAQLEAYQNEPTSKEAIETIPLLKIEDINRKAEPVYNEEIKQDGLHLLEHAIETNGILYLNLMFDLKHIATEDIGYMGILTEVLGSMNTADYTYQDLADEVNLHTGGMKTNVSIYGAVDADSYTPVFEFSAKAVYDKIPAAFGLITSILTATDFSDHKRLKDILFQLKSRLEAGFMSSGHSTAVNRATAYFSQGSWYKEQIEGIAFYQFLCGVLQDYEEQKQTIVTKLQQLMQQIFRAEYMMCEMTAMAEGFELALPELKTLSDKLYTTALSEEARTPKKVGTCPTHNEAFITTGTVQYNACAGNFKQAGIAYNGSLNVLKNVIGNEFLWKNIREKGGAYGCMCGFVQNGNGYFTSYRDPKLGETYDVYEKVAAYVENIHLEPRELTKYIIGAIGAVDTPLTPSMKGARSLAAFMSHRSFADIQQTRDELLDTTDAILREQAGLIAAVVKAGHICVVGSESSIMSEKERFEKIEKLIQ